MGPIDELAVALPVDDDEEEIVGIVVDEDADVVADEEMVDDEVELPAEEDLVVVEVVVDAVVDVLAFPSWFMGQLSPHVMFKSLQPRLSWPHCGSTGVGLQFPGSIPPLSMVWPCGPRVSCPPFRA